MTTTDYAQTRANERREDCTTCGKTDMDCTELVLKGKLPCCTQCGETDTHPPRTVPNGPDPLDDIARAVAYLSESLKNTPHGGAVVFGNPLPLVKHTGASARDIANAIHKCGSYVTAVNEEIRKAALKSQMDRAELEALRHERETVRKFLGTTNQEIN